MNSTIAIRLAIIIIACYSIVTIVDFIEKDRYDEITESQIRDIAAAEEITVLAEKRLNDREKPAALIFYEKGIYIGSYSVFNRNGNIEYAKTLTTHKSRGKPVEKLGGHGGFSYIMLKVNDNRIRENMSRIVVTFGAEAEVATEASPHRSSYIIVYDPPEKGRMANRSSDIRIYDPNEELLYHSD
ncbi:hypothetical protein E2R60_27990 [Paenibacillus dendritiformis]|uniref:hypothetical protein n=1 Tax=Paenibacillus dendritiformis TaxID=130049 RepID=UPI001059EE22|nr:hypothetical protein [Paenibacillus dendritiformis]TDL47942.1 hypothetical protein E2R60_27990 [Paenibacillus dendritiformis]